MGLATAVGDVTRTSIAKVQKVRSEGTHYPKVIKRLNIIDYVYFMIEISSASQYVTLCNVILNPFMLCYVLLYYVALLFITWM